MNAAQKVLPIDRAVEVVVIGGGIVGCAAAYYLAKAGVPVALFEKGRIAGEQSSRNWGAVRQQGRHPAELPLMMACNRIWQGLEQELEADLDWRRQGQLRVAYSAERLASFEAWMPTAREHQLDTRILTPREVADLLPNYHAEGCLGGMYTASDGCAEPEKVAPAFAAAAGRQGAAVFDHCAVIGIDLKAGQIYGVETERGYLRCDKVICAGGAWSSRILRPLGLRHPSLWVRGSVAQTTALGIDLRKLVVWGKDCAYRQRPDGSLTLAAAEEGFHDVNLDSLRYGTRFLALARKNRPNLRLKLGRPLLQDLRGEFSSFTQQRTLDPRPDLPSLWRAAEGFRSEYPSADAFGFQRVWAGWIDYMPDELPVIDAPGRPEGLVIATGMSGHGFGLGPMAGRLAAELAGDGQPSHDLSAFRADRFSSKAM